MKIPEIIVEKHPDGYVAYPLGLRGIVIAEGDTCEEALAEVKSAIQFHIETFGNGAFENNDIMETFVAEAPARCTPAEGVKDAGGVRVCSRQDG